MKRKFAQFAGVILLVGLGIPANAQVQNLSGTVGRWLFNESYGITANDSSGLGNNGTLSGAAMFTSDPVRGNVLSIQDVSGHVEVPYSTALQPATGTISIWVNPSVAQLSDVVRKNTDLLVQCGYSGLFYAYDLRISDRGTAVAILANDDPKTCVKRPQIFLQSHANAVKPNQWTHLAMRWDGSTLSLFVNGTIVGSTKYNANPDTGLSYHGTYPLDVASAIYDFNSGYLEYTGSLSDLSVYSRALSDSEIAGLAQGPK